MAYGKVVPQRTELSTLILQIVDQLGILSVPVSSRQAYRQYFRSSSHVSFRVPVLFRDLLSGQDVLQLEDRGIDRARSVLEENVLERVEDLFSEQGGRRAVVEGTLVSRRAYSIPIRFTALNS